MSCVEERRSAGQGLGDAHDAGQLLFYVPAVDRPAARLAKPDYDEMRAEPNIGATAKMPGLLPLFVGMEVWIGID